MRELTPNEQAAIQPFADALIAKARETILANEPNRNPTHLRMDSVSLAVDAVIVALDDADEVCCLLAHTLGCLLAQFPPADRMQLLRNFSYWVAQGEADERQMLAQGGTA